MNQKKLIREFKQWIEAEGYRMSAVAEKLDLSISHFSCVINGKTGTSRKVEKKMRKLMGMED